MLQPPLNIDQKHGYLEHTVQCSMETTRHCELHANCGKCTVMPHGREDSFDRYTPRVASPRHDICHCRRHLRQSQRLLHSQHVFRCCSGKHFATIECSPPFRLLQRLYFGGTLDLPSITAQEAGRHASALQKPRRTIALGTESHQIVLLLTWALSPSRTSHRPRCRSSACEQPIAVPGSTPAFSTSVANLSNSRSATWHLLFGTRRIVCTQDAGRIVERCR